MFSRFAILVAATMAVFVSALPAGDSTNCSTGPVQCCNQTYQGSSNEAAIIAALLNIKVPVNTLLGFNCSPITGIGRGGSNCQAQTVCCENNHFNGVVAIGCSPVNVNL